MNYTPSAWIGDITGKVFDLRETPNTIIFKSKEQLSYDKCDFKLNGTEYLGWKIKVMSYNDFGGETKHEARKLNTETNP